LGFNEPAESKYMVNDLEDPSQLILRL
jgi:hypothetical protein